MTDRNKFNSDIEQLAIASSGAGNWTKERLSRKRKAVGKFRNGMGEQRAVTPLHAVPDKSIVNFAIDLSDLEGTNIHLGASELIHPELDAGASGTVATLVPWLRKGCHATMIPLDGQNTKHMAWMRDVLAGVVGGLNEVGDTQLDKGADGRSTGGVKTGMVWKRVDGLDTDVLEEIKKEFEPSYATRKDSWMSQASQMSELMSARCRPDSARIKPRSIVRVKDAADLAAVLEQCLVCTSGRVGAIKEDCVLSLVFHDEDNCLFSMLHVAVARSRVSFLNLASLVEEIGQLHAAGQAGDFRLRSAETTDLNALASHYIRGDAKLFVVAYPQCEDYSYVSKIVSVCATSQTVWTDLVWLDADFVRRTAGVVSWEARHSAGESEEQMEGADLVYDEDSDNDLTVYEVETRQGEPSFGGGHQQGEEGSLASCFRSPSIQSIRQSLQERAARELSTAARHAALQLDDDESPTAASPALPCRVVPGSVDGVHGKSLTERRLLFPSLRQSVNGIRASHVAHHEERDGGFADEARNQPTDQGSRDVFSSLRTIDIQGRNGRGGPDFASISLQNPSNTLRDLDSNDSEPSEACDLPDGQRDRSRPSEPTNRIQTLPLVATKEVFDSIEAKINDRFAAKIKDLQERLEVSEMRRIQLQSSYDVLKDGPAAGWDFSDNQSLIKSLQEEVKRSNALEAEMSSMKQEQLGHEVELEAKDKTIQLLHARIRALESDSDVSTAYDLCEEALEKLKEENCILREENADLHGKIAAMEVSTLMTANGISAILPEDENYDIDGAEARIIYKLHDKLKLASRRAKRLEAEKSELRSKLHEVQRAERVAIVTKNVCEKLKKKVNALQRELYDAQKLNASKTPRNGKHADHNTKPGRCRRAPVDVQCFI